MASRRTLTYVAIALILGAALALAVALARNSSAGAPSASRSAATAQAQAQAAILGDSGGAASLASTDPAKEEPLLDKFVSKDPFVPLPTANTTSTSSSETSDGTGGDASTSTSTLSAHVVVNGTAYTVSKNDEVPGASPAFRIGSVTSSDVTFAVISGSLKNGDSSVTVNLGESVTATLQSGKNYTLKVSQIGNASGGGGSRSVSGGNTISVLSISSNNGTGVVTVEVNGKTYPDKKIGDTFNTSYGQIKILGIDVSAQTVTMMHGDQTLLLRANQVVVK